MDGKSENPNFRREGKISGGLLFLKNDSSCPSMFLSFLKSIFHNNFLFIHFYRRAFRLFFVKNKNEWIVLLSAESWMFICIYMPRINL